MFKGVFPNVAIRNVFQQEAVGTAAPVVAKLIFRHLYLPRVHHCHASTIVVKPVVVIVVIVRKHKMKPVAQVMFAVIVPNFGVCYKFKIDSIALACEVILRDQGPSAFPQMNAVSAVLLFF